MMGFGQVLGAFGLALLPMVVSAQATRPQDPEPPFPYASTDVSYVNADDGTMLTGTLTIPDGVGRVPAALLISGAGPQDRDYEALGHRPFLVLADHLSRSGIAVLRVDDRGAGGSSGDAGQASVADIVGDLRAGVAFLGANPRVDPGAIGLVAHSEGGRVAPLAALDILNVGFMVLLAPPVLRASDLARVQTVSAMEVSDDPLIAVQASLIALIRETVRDEPDPGRATARILEGWEDWLTTLPADQAEILAVLRGRDPFVAQIETLTAALATPWNRELYELDTSPSLAAVEMPVLALYGDLDRQTPPRWNVPILQGTWRGHPDATIRVLPGLNHFFQHAETGLASEVPEISETLAPEVLESVSTWLGERFGPPSQ